MKGTTSELFVAIIFVYRRFAERKIRALLSCCHQAFIALVDSRFVVCIHEAREILDEPVIKSLVLNPDCLKEFPVIIRTGPDDYHRF